ncbi:MAG: HAD-IIB family hydrolase [Candidatus Azobacteroides sp.]|nr:HAD-IIB family hydrolase [Candidatus Azobacteroides sp.]
MDKSEKIEEMQSFPWPEYISRIVFTDYDETYMPYDPVNKSKSGIPELESFLIGPGKSLSLIMGWVSGSSLDSLLRKSRGYVTYLPHFIASSLGTELYWIKEKEIIPCEEWFERIRHSGFKRENITRMIALLRETGISLREQPADYGGKYKGTYYYKITSHLEEDYNRIKEVAADLKIKVLFTKCNPAAGDPADCYDVDLLPECCGKENVVSFLSEYTGVKKEDTWAFGDSFNDFKMFAEAENSYLVANADPLAAKSFSHMTNSSYCFGIKETLKQLY